MSGTSVDAVDVALIRTDGETIDAFGPAVERKYQTDEREIIQQATQAARDWNWSGSRPEAAFARAREVVVSTHFDAWKMLDKLLDSAPTPPRSTYEEGMTKPRSGAEPGPKRGDVKLLGVHGQTVLHRRPRPGQIGETLQLMDGTALAHKTGLPVAHDFRTADVAAGGEGAPLAPIYHKALLDRLGGGPAVVLNLGGVANITAKLKSGDLVAFDTGPANGPVDEWVERHGYGAYDEGGELAARGQIDEARLATWLKHDWFRVAPPKSLDRYDFSANLADGLSLEDGAATLTAFSAHAVAAGLAQLPDQPARVIACGGGRHNPVLMQRLAETLPCQLLSAEEAGWRGDSIEAEAFAFLAVRTLRGLPISWPGTTGVPRAMTGGVVTRP